MTPEERTEKLKKAGYSNLIITLVNRAVPAEADFRTGQLLEMAERAELVKDANKTLNDMLQAPFARGVDDYGRGEAAPTD